MGQGGDSEGAWATGSTEDLYTGGVEGAGETSLRVALCQLYLASFDGCEAGKGPPTPRAKGSLDVPTPTPTALATPTAVRNMQLTALSQESGDLSGLAAFMDGGLQPLRAGDAASPQADVLGLSGAKPTSASNVVADVPGRGEIARTICSYPWPQGCSYWLGVAFCESSYRERVVVRAWPDGYYVGWFQIWTGHGYTIEYLQDGANNVQAAWELSGQGRYAGAWPACQWQGG